MSDGIRQTFALKGEHFPVEDSITDYEQEQSPVVSRANANRLTPKGFANRLPTPNVKLERPDISLLAQTGDPAFLNLLRFVLNQFFLNVCSRFGE